MADPGQEREALTLPNQIREVCDEWIASDWHVLRLLSLAEKVEAALAAREEPRSELASESEQRHAMAKETSLDTSKMRTAHGDAERARAAREATERSEELHEEMLDLLEEAIWAVGVNPLAGKIQAILLKYGR